MEIVCLSLIGLVVFQQIYYMRQVQKLIDKLMSRSYTEYKTADIKQPVDRPKLKDEPVDDLRVLNSFTNYP